MKLLLAYLKPYKWLMALTLLMAAINQVFSLLDPLIFGKMFDKYVTNRDTIELARGEFLWGVAGYLGLLIGVAMVSRIAKAFQDYFGNVVVQKFGARIFTDGLRHSLKLPYWDFEDQRSGETLSILSKVRSDTEKFITSFNNILFGIFVGIVFVAVYSFSLHWSIMPVYVAGIAFLSLLTSVLSRKIKKIQKRIVGQTNDLAGATTESLRNIELVKSLGLTNQEILRLNRNTYKILGLELQKVKSIRTLSFIQGTFVNFLRQVILFILLWLIYEHTITPGQLMTLTFYSFFIFGPLQEVGNIIIYYREAEASLNNFKELMKKEPEPRPLNPVPLGSINSLEFRNVSFQHKTADHPAVSHFSFNAKSGDTIAFAGPSGSGKSTLVKLLVGLYRPQEGNILYNGSDLENIDPDVLRKQLGFVTQDTQLFAGTIRENLLFVNPEATDSQMLDVLKRAACYNLLERGGQGLDTLIGEGGVKISGGERQRLSIARALLRNPNLLIFDEATSSLDSLTEEEITRTIIDVSSRKEQITILIAHRLSTIMHADKIYVLEKGRIIEQGTHHTLLEQKGLYYAMWRQQIGERSSLLQSIP
ncbi:MAG: ABC transporter ATP-binding protein/permease [Chitinophagales bacterium]|nr:ABC transporter ATP-binding protein/permease [Chitinophagales bacterium]